MDKFKFARLLSYISCITHSQFNESQIAEIDRMIADGMPMPKASVTSPDRLNDLLLCLNQPGRFIEAIKVYRELTDAGLQDAKHAIESYRNTKGME